MPRNDTAPTPPDQNPPMVRLIWSMIFVSACVLGFEIALMRILLVASWHHFAFLVISIALLGFGGSGSVLLFARDWLLARGPHAMRALVALAAASMPICAAIAQHVPIEARLVPVLLWRQIGWWLLYWAVLTIPFLLGATAIGLGLMLARQRVAAMYAANLIGSGAGALLVTLAMAWIEPAWLPAAMGAIGLIGSLGRGFWSIAATLAACMWLFVDPPHIRPDPFKYAAHFERLRQQGSATRIAHEFSARGVIEVYRGGVFHEMPFLSLGATPPPLHALVIDGHWTGSVLNVGHLEQAAAVERTMMSVPYALIDADRPAVLLLGERGGANIWLAALRGAARIDVVQPDPKLPAILRRVNAHVLDLPGARAVVADPRHFVDRGGLRYDLVQLVTLEGSAAGSGGVAGLGQDHLVTVEGIESCLRRLEPQGMLFVCRGIQTPPRDELKLIATFADALRGIGIDEPGRHVVVVRDYLAVCVMLRPTPWSSRQVERVRDICRARQLTPVWFDGIRDDELNHPDAMPGPAGLAGDWHHHAARQLLSARSASLIDQWQFDIRPPTDDRPFFLDFCRLRSIGALREAFGELWLTRAEIAYLFVLAAIGLIAFVAAVVTILPVLLLRAIRSARGLATVAAYFGAIGLAYLMLEITMLSRFAHLIGDPVLSASVTITTFLVGSGLGSMIAGRLAYRAERTVTIAVILIVLLTAATLGTMGLVARWCAPLADITRMAIAAALMLPAAVLMGVPMPTALRRLNDAGAQLVPWAWGVNGFASVLAAPIATAIAMTWGFWLAAIAAAVLYALAAIIFPKL